MYGKAFAINKKSAKNKAALATLEMLIPGFKVSSVISLQLGVCLQLDKYGEYILCLAATQSTDTAVLQKSESQ